MKLYCDEQGKLILPLIQCSTKEPNI